MELSPRESQIAKLMCKGWSDERIAKKLGNQPGTVRQQRKRIYLKLGVHSRSEAIARLSA